MRKCSSALRAVAARMREDIATVQAKDPAAESRYEVLLYPHIHALWTYRVAHRLWHSGHRLTARALSLGARVVSGIEIHPAAVIGRRFFIDHGTAVVIGATVRIGDDVMLYHQVTLGSVGWWKDLRRPARARRHPVVEDGVIIGTGASVLGPVTVGAGARIGAHAVVVTDLEPEARVTAPASEIHPSSGFTPDPAPADAAPTGSVADAPAPDPAVPEPATNRPESAVSGARGATPAPEREPAVPPASDTALPQPAQGQPGRPGPVTPAAVRPAAPRHAGPQPVRPSAPHVLTADSGSSGTALPGSQPTVPEPAATSPLPRGPRKP
ncbi:serine O-acetyltransferase EpsC [Streptomyces botrytidirepellens]|uniref:serine O-acetyltransferase EpsC n=1 Tax=Streptomyces botrytidirepellens TaxID=2486417 RepID=UPI001FE5BF3A|nr:serine O-acetyltransferase EpsC [Streptomyces botrytidirepellens]